MAVRVGEKQLLENIAATRRAHWMWARDSPGTMKSIVLSCLGI